MIEQIEQVRKPFLARPDRGALLELLPAGGARCALDSALWDLESKRTGERAWRRAGFASLRSLVTAYTLGMRPLAELEAAAAARASYPLLKIKVGSDAPLDIVRTVHAAAPKSRLIVDANQSWTFEQLRAYPPACRDLGVVLLEQPLDGGSDADLLGYDCPVPICADEVIHVAQDLPKVIGKYGVINVKLDKSGGLTAGLELAREALKLGLRLMVGCMAGSSLAMAPAMVLGQLCEFVDLDGPLLQRSDWSNGLRYDDGLISPPDAALWG
jgi:L-Ala-D/L-Glu epimerase